MTALLKSELLKLRTTRTFPLLAGTAIVVTALLVGLAAAVVGDMSRTGERSLLQARLAETFILVLGVLGMAGEWRHRTIAGTLLAVPDRLRLFAAKVAVYALVGAALSLVVTLVSYATVTVILNGQGGDALPLGDVDDLLWENPLVAAYYGALGVAVGGLLRNQVGAIVAVLAVLYLGEPAVLGLWPELGRWQPLVGAPTGLVAGPGFEDLLPSGVAAIAMLGWLVVFCGSAAASFRIRDVV